MKPKKTNENKVVIRQVDVESLFSALYRNREAKLSDHAKTISM